MSDKQHQADDRYARESFSMRTMKQWQVWAISIVAAAVVIGLLLIYAW